MIDIPLLTTTVLHVVETFAARLARSRYDNALDDRDGRGASDRGAVSLEQVLWFVAAGVSVAVIAAILWGQIRDQANTPINSPSAP
jgi:hypothetical protein